MNYTTKHERIERIGRITIWVVSVIIPALIFLLSLPYFYDVDLWVGCRIVGFHALFTLPILSTIVMYFMLVYTLKKKMEKTEITNVITNTCNNTRNQMKNMTRMTRGVVICLLICNLPMMAWAQWWGLMLQKGTEEAMKEVFGTHFGVHILRIILF